MKKPLFNFIKLNCFGRKRLDIKKATLDGKFLSHLKEYCDIAVFPDFREVNILGGSSDGANYIAPALAMANYHTRFGPIHCSIVREVTKYYGTPGDFIESKNSGDKNILIFHDFLNKDNVLNFHQGCWKFKNAGYNIKGIIIIVNDDSDLLKELKKEFQTHVASIFDYSEFI